MPTITLTVPEEVKLELKRLSWVNWSEVAREVFLKRQERMEALERVEKILSKSKFTEKDADELGEKVKKSMHERLKKSYPFLK